MIISKIHDLLLESKSMKVDVAKQASTFCSQVSSESKKIINRILQFEESLNETIELLEQCSRNTYLYESLQEKLPYLSIPSIAPATVSIFFKMSKFRDIKLLSDVIFLDHDFQNAKIMRFFPLLKIFQHLDIDKYTFSVNKNTSIFQNSRTYAIYPSDPEHSNLIYFFSRKNHKLKLVLEIDDMASIEVIFTKNYIYILQKLSRKNTSKCLKYMKEEKTLEKSEIQVSGIESAIEFNGTIYISLSNKVYSYDPKSNQITVFLELKSEIYLIFILDSLVIIADEAPRIIDKSVLLIDRKELNLSVKYPQYGVVDHILAWKIDDEMSTLNFKTKELKTYATI